MFLLIPPRMCRSVSRYVSQSKSRMIAVVPARARLVARRTFLVHLRVRSTAEGPRFTCVPILCSLNSSMREAGRRRWLRVCCCLTAEDPCWCLRDSTSCESSNQPRFRRDRNSQQLFLEPTESELDH